MAIEKVKTKGNKEERKRGVESVGKYRVRETKEM
jgi:hypothetical protein